MVTDLDGVPLTVRYPLQWSHGRLTVVTVACQVVGGVLRRASMEPRSFNRGDPVKNAGTVDAVKEASMEPRSFNRGDFDEMDKIAREIIASMEPRSFNRGDPPPRPHSPRRRTCFNGATVV